jgi:YVTN family beta-propeller protein
MNLRISGLLAVAAVAIAGLIGSAQALAQSAYITINYANTVSVIDTPTNTVTATIPVGSSPTGVAATPDGSKVYVTQGAANTVSVIDTATNTVVGSPIPVGRSPWPTAIAIGPVTFAGTPGFSNCRGQSGAALTQQYGSMNAAAAALGYPSVQALQSAIRTFCRV